MGSGIATKWGTHADFVELYEFFLNGTYPSGSSQVVGDGRWRLTRSIAAELRSRGAKRVLDCAAGTGFPAINLAASTSLPWLVIHCTDGDPEMLRVLRSRASEKNIDVDRLAPRLSRCAISDGLGPMQLTWSQLNGIEETYDYVMCRGNSLAYADTWTGRRKATSKELIRQYLAKMAKRVRLGGHLHIDAPWQLDLAPSDYRPLDKDGGTIYEQVTVEADTRYWRVSFERPDRQAIVFERFSTLLTIYDVKTILDELGFEDTDPFELEAEREGFGVIIAHKVR